MRRLAALLLALTLALGLAAPAAALTDEEAGALFTFEPGEAYTVLDRTNLRQNRDFLERLGYTVSAFAKAMEEGNVYLCAATPDNDRQAQVRCWGGGKDDGKGTAQELGDLSYLTDEQREIACRELGAQAAGTGELLAAQTVEREGQTFFRFRVRSDVTLESDESAVGYCFDEYLTVANGSFCALIYYNFSGDFSAADEAESARLFAAFSVAPTAERKDWLNGALRIFAALVLLAAAVTAVFVLSTFVRDVRIRREQPDSIPDRIKMRRK